MNSQKHNSMKLREVSFLSASPLLVYVVLPLALLVNAHSAHARCDDGQREIATLFMEDARANTDDIEKLVLLKKSAKACPDFVIWVELGKVQLALDNTDGAASAFESARNYYFPDDSGSYTSDQVMRHAISSGWLAETYRSGGELASASVATKEAKEAFEVLNQQPPQRLVRLQAEIDDAMANADASILVRSLELQHERATRGIGVRAKVRPSDEPAEEVAVTAQLAADYRQDDTVTVASIQAVTSETSDLSVADSDQRPLTESRLNIPVLFDYNSADLSSASRDTVTQLGKAINALQLDGTATVMIVGHTDVRGTAAYNQTLSERRANSVLAEIQTFVQSGLRFDSTGRGEQEPRYVGSTENDHRRNRRVEVIVRR